MNPIIFFDEVDKISKTEKGFELEKLLINIADNTQNNNFNDKYFMELNFDLSKILFIFSYNNKKFIDPILYDRIFEIEFKNYNKSQKLDLCKKFIIPNLFNNYSFKHNSLIFSDDSITFLINKYSHKSSGIRTIKKVLNNIISKIHIIYISNNSSIINIKYNITFPFTINISNINNFL